MSYGNPDPAHPVKFIKSLISPPELFFSGAEANRMFFKLIYEFWGFCVNGTDNLTTAGGFATSGTLSLPAGFRSGTGSLLSAGSDGRTTFGDSIFASDSSNFQTLASGTIRNKYLVIWKTDDPSPDDSVYRIVGIEDPTRIRVRIDTAGTTRLGGKAYFSDRSKIRFRVIDMSASIALPGWNTQPILTSASMIMNFGAAPNVNVGQAVSQLKIDLLFSSSIVKMTVSPSGSWDGLSGFTDASTPISQSWVAGNSGRGQYTLIGGRDFLMTFMKGEDGAWAGNASIQPGFHIEIPERLYPQQNDPNPITWALWGDSSLGMSPTTGSYANGFKMVCQDGVTRDWTTLVRTPTAVGTHVHYAITPASGGMWYGFTQSALANYGRVHFNNFSGTYMTTDATLMQSGSATNPQYSMSRVRLRRVRFSARNLPAYLRLGQRWMHVGGGVLWPWDGSQVPEGLFWEGGGAQPGEVEG